MVFQSSRRRLPTDAQNSRRVAIPISPVWAADLPILLGQPKPPNRPILIDRGNATTSVHRQKAHLKYKEMSGDQKHVTTTKLLLLPNVLSIPEMYPFPFSCCCLTLSASRRGQDLMQLILDRDRSLFKPAIKKAHGFPNSATRLSYQGCQISSVRIWYIF